MNEWRRVFLDPGRLGLLILAAAVCLGVFVLDMTGSVTPEAVRTELSVNEYVTELVEDCRGRSWEDILSLVESRRERVRDVNAWYYFPAYSDVDFATLDDAAEYVADMPALAEALRRDDSASVHRVLAACYEAFDAVSGQAEYLAGYGDYLAGIQSQAEIQSQTSLFGKPGTFARRNLEKTAAEFRRLLGVRVEFGNDRGIDRWLEFELGDYFHLFAIVLIVMSFLEERRRGLWPAVRAARYGRLRLGLTRICILLAGSVLATALFSFVPFLLSMGLRGGWGDLSRPLQSVESFAVCPLPISIRQWLVRFFVLKVFSGVLIGLLLWCVLGSVANPQFSTAVLGLTLAAEYGLYEYLPVQSILNGLKYFNIFAYVHTSSLYTNYLNVDLLGFAAGSRDIAVWGIAVIGTLAGAWVVLMHMYRRPEGTRDHLSRVTAPVNRVLDRVRIRLGLSGWEGYKSLVFQYGVLLLGLAYIVSGQMTYLGSSFAPRGQHYDAYIADMDGPITENTDAYIIRARALAAENQEAASLLSALDRVEERVSHLRQRAEAGGYEPWIVTESDYDVAFGPQGRARQRLNAAAAILMVAVLTASLWSFERQAGVVLMLRSAPGGRRRLFRRKALTAALLAVFVWGCVYIREIVFMLRDYRQLTCLDAPLGNFDSLAGFPLNITFGQFMALVYAMRLVMLLFVSQAGLALGMLCSNVRAALLTASGLLGVPSLLTALGAEMFKWVSPAVPVASAELAWGLGSGDLSYVLPWVVWAGVSVAVTAVVWEKWVKG